MEGLWKQFWRRRTRSRKGRARGAPSPSTQAYLAHKETARAFITTRTHVLAAAHGFAVRRIAIRNTRRSWGSCSAKGNLNFNYKLLFLPPCLSDYIIVHELCHLRHLNHSAAFWEEVLAIMPDALVRSEALRRHERALGTSRGALAALCSAHSACASCITLEHHRPAVFVPPQSESRERTVG